jgi:DNA topoisomerase-1
MEKRNLGTKATRSQIVDILFKRGYVEGKTLEVTALGLNVVDTLNKYCPEVVSETLTRKFEEEMEDIQEGKRQSSEVIDEGRETLTKILSEFQNNEMRIGESLGQSVVDEQRRQLHMGPCPKCTKALVMRASKFGGQFIGCSGYPNCNFTLPLPKMKIKKIGECEQCGYALMSTVGQRRKWTFCVNPACPTRQKKEAEEKAAETGTIEKIPE